jgi:hypothetical protein
MGLTSWGDLNVFKSKPRHTAFPFHNGLPLPGAGKTATTCEP